MTASQIIVLAIPVFLLMMMGEYALARHRGLQVYRFSDAINSLSLGGLSQLSGLFTKLLAVGIYTALYQWVAVYPDTAFWSTWYGVLLALVFYDFCYYWLHRAGHEVAVFWAAHVVHHQSQQYNLSTALRQTSSGALLGWVFYLPMAVAGVPPLIFGIVALIDLLYQFWVHTELVRKLGWFDRVFCSPSNHRVHHAVNDQYLDKNYGGILILWDRLFGSFREEAEPCVYGTRSALRSWDPLWANAEVYAQLLQDSWRARNWRDKLRVWYKAPGWRPADVAQRWPKPVFDIHQVRIYNPPLTRAAMLFVGAGFVVLLAGVAAVLWFAHRMDASAVAIWSAALVVTFWTLGAVLQSRLSVLAALVIQCGALATATGVLGPQEWHFVFKPLAMVLALLLVLQRLDSDRAKNRMGWYLLIAALTGSLLGDVTLYVAVICLMAAQAIGRATAVRDRASALVALGACVFMASDTLIAVNRFVAPMPLASLWILATYYLAQVLIVLHVRPATTAPTATGIGLSAGPA